MSRILTLLPVISLLGACSSTVGSGVSATEVRDATGATALEQRTWLPTTVRTGPALEIEVTCDDNLLDEIITEVVEGVLVVREPLDLSSLTTNVPCAAVVELPVYDRVLNGGSGPMTLEGDFEPLPDLRATASGPVTGTGSIMGLVALLCSGSGAIDLPMVEATDLELRHPGSAAVTIDVLTADTVDVSNSGSGATMLAGSATSAVIEISGSGAVGDRDFVVDEADVILSGSGGLELTVTGRVSITLSGAGSATIFGDPKDRDVDDSGTGTVTFE